MRLIPPHPWNTQDSHSHTSPLKNTPPHQKVQNCYWNYLMTDLKIQHFWCPSRRSHHHYQRSPWMSPGINSGRIGASADKRIADKRARMGMLRPPFSKWLFDLQEPSLLPQASSLHNSFLLQMVLLSSLSYMSYLAQYETLPQIIHSATHGSQGVCYWYGPQQTLCRSKEWSQKEEEEDEVYGQDDYNQFQAEIEESLPEKGMVLKRLDVLDLVLEKAQFKSEQHE